MKFDMNRLEIIDPDLSEAENPIWSGTVDEYTVNNANWPMSEDEIETLASRGFVVIGGGAMSVFVVRYATEEARATSRAIIENQAR